MGQEDAVSVAHMMIQEGVHNYGSYVDTERGSLLVSMLTQEWVGKDHIDIGRVQYVE